MSFLLFAAPLLAGCALPGYHIKEDAGKAGLLDRDGNELAQSAPGSELRVRSITPDLIRELNSSPQVSSADLLPNSLGTGPENDSTYRVGPGDLLQVLVYGHPELNNPTGTTQNVEAAGRVVDAAGEIYFPFVGKMRVAGRTIDEIREALTGRLDEVLQAPQVDVRVLEFRSKHIFITGDVNRPCAVPVTDIPLTVYQALESCEALMDRDAGVRSLRLVRNGESYLLDLAQRYGRDENLRLQPGDTLVLDNRLDRVFLVGEFEKQTAVQLGVGGLTLADAIAAAGGLNLDTADAANIFVIRGLAADDAALDVSFAPTVRPEVFQLNARSADSFILADQFQLQARDVVYAAPAGMVSFNRGLALIMPSVDVLFRSFLLYDRYRD